MLKNQRWYAKAVFPSYLPRHSSSILSKYHGVRRQQNDQQNDYRRQPFHHVEKDVESHGAVGGKQWQVTRQNIAIVGKSFEDVRGHGLLLGGVLAFDEDHRTFARRAQRFLHRLERDLDACAGFGLVNADDGQVAPQRPDLVADFDRVVRGPLVIDDSDVARLRQRLPLDDAQIGGGGEALKIYAVDLANTGAAAG